MTRGPPWLLLALTLACGRGKDQPADTGEEPPDAELPQAELDSSTLDFGAAEVGGDPATATLALRNTGGASLSITGIATTDPSGPFAIGDLPGARVAPGETLDLTLTFTPRVVGESTDELVLETDDPDDPALRVELLGQGDGPELALLTEETELGVVLVGCERELDIELNNQGTTPLSVDAVDGGAEAWTLNLRTGANGELPWTLYPGNSKRVRLSFAPLEPGEPSHSLSAHSDDPVSPTRSLTFSADAVSASPVTDSWTITGQLDLLFVLDTGSASAPYVNTLREEIDALFAGLDAQGLDWQVSAVGDADGCVNGSDPAVTDSMTSSKQTATFRNQSSGGDHSMNDAGFDLAALALSQAEDCNEGVLREGSNLAVVHVSAQEDGSALSPSEAVALYARAISPAAQLSVHAFAGETPDGCESAEAGVRFEEAVDATGGTFSSICEEVTYRGDLGRLANAVAATNQTVFSLSQEPVEETLVVRVDGEALTRGWAYDPAEQAVEFTASSAPALGSVMDIEYDSMPSNCD